MLRRQTSSLQSETKIAFLNSLEIFATSNFRLFADETKPFIHYKKEINERRIWHGGRPTKEKLAKKRFIAL